LLEIAGKADLCFLSTMELLERMFAASSASAQLEGDKAVSAIWKLEIFWWQAQLENDKATTATWELEIFGGRPSWKVTGSQLQSGDSRFLGAGPVGKCDRATTAIRELEIFGGRPC